MSQKLTDRICREAEPPPASSPHRAIALRDSEVPGLALRITKLNEGDDGKMSGGVKSFVLDYRVRGSRLQRRMTLGRWGVEYQTVSAARQRAKELRRQIAEGGDPMGDIHEHREAATMNELAARYIEEHAKPNKAASSVADDEIMLRQWVRPEFGTKKVRDITHDEVVRLHRKITASGTPARANRCASLLSKMFSLAIKWRMRSDHPVKGLERNPEHGREQYLSDEEQTRLMAVLAKREAQDREAVAAIRLLMYTGARRGETLAMRWEDVDLDKLVWQKPAETTKARRLHRVPLSPLAGDVIASLRDARIAEKEAALKLARDASAQRNIGKRGEMLVRARRAKARAESEYVFPGKEDGSALTTVRGVWHEIRAEAKIPHIRLHDLRHSFASILVSSGRSLEEISALLGHAAISTTQRYSHLFDAPLRSAAATVAAAYSNAAAAPSPKPNKTVIDFPGKPSRHRVHQRRQKSAAK